MLESESVRLLPPIKVAVLFEVEVFDLVEEEGGPEIELLQADLLATVAAAGFTVDVEVAEIEDLGEETFTLMFGLGEEGVQEAEGEEEEVDVVFGIAMADEVEVVTLFPSSLLFPFCLLFPLLSSPWLDLPPFTMELTNRYQDQLVRWQDAATVSIL